MFAQNVLDKILETDQEHDPITSRETLKYPIAEYKEHQRQLRNRYVFFTNLQKEIEDMIDDNFGLDVEDSEVR